MLPKQPENLFVSAYSNVTHCVKKFERGWLMSTALTEIFAPSSNSPSLLLTIFFVFSFFFEKKNPVFSFFRKKKLRKKSEVYMALSKASKMLLG